MRLWRIFGDAAETDMRCGSDGIREEGAKTSLPLLQVCLSSPSAASQTAQEEKPKTAKIHATRTKGNLTQYRHFRLK